MATIKSTIAPQSAVARFVLADIKGGESAHNYRMAVIATAVLEAYKGNPNNIAEAKAFSAGKSRKAKAYQAAFGALELLPDALVKLPYVGKWDASHNAMVREQAALLCQAAEFAFESAFLTATINAKLEADAVKATAAQAKVDAPAESSTEADPTDTPDMVADGVTINIGAAVEAVAMAVQQGMLQVDEMTLLRAALASFDAAQDKAAMDARSDAIIDAHEAELDAFMGPHQITGDDMVRALLAATSPLVQAQAH